MTHVQDNHYDQVKAIINKGIVSFFEQWDTPIPTTVSMEDFDRIRTLGAGAFGRVMLIKDKKSQEYHAMKILTKAMIVKTKQVDHVITEKRILQAMSFTYIVKIHFGFQDNSYLYICLEFIGGGELFTYLRSVRRLNEKHAKIYIAQIVLAFQYLQALDIIYRDLKPENILIDPAGYLKMTDFGFAKRTKGRTYTMCGTPEYIAPEIIQNKGYGNSCDWWSLGILIFELNAGHPPFYAGEQMNIYEKIIEGKYKCPPYFSHDLKDLLKRLIQKDLTFRFGNLVGGFKDVTGHPWFQEIDWLALLEKKITVPYQPKTSGAGDASNFETYTEETLKIDERNQFGAVFNDF